MVRGGSLRRRTAPIPRRQPWVRQPWDLVVKNPDHLIRDFEATPSASVRPFASSPRSPLIGSPGRLSIHRSAQIDPYTALDTTNGPITIDAGVIIQPFTRIEGPSYVGQNTQLYPRATSGEA